MSQSLRRIKRVGGMRLCCYLSICWCFCLYSLSAVGQDVTITQDIDFGDIVVVDNTTQGVIDIDQVGNFTVSRHFRIIRPGRAGIVEFSNFLQHAEVFITGHVTQPVAAPEHNSKETFTLTRINVPVSFYTKGDGSALLPIGAQITTSGSGSLAFSDTTFKSKIRLLFQY